MFGKIEFWSPKGWGILFTRDSQGIITKYFAPAKNLIRCEVEVPEAWLDVEFEVSAEVPTKPSGYRVAEKIQILSKTKEATLEALAQPKAGA